MAKRKENSKSYILDIVAVVVLAVIIGITMPFSRKIEIELGLLYAVDASTVDESDVVYVSGSTVAYADGETASLSVHYLDVGQGDCTVIEFPDGKTMVIDGGENNKKTEQAIQSFIDVTLPTGFKYFDYAILTHPDSDHCGSLDYVLENYPARVVYRPNVEAVGTEKNPYSDPGKADLSAGAVTKDTAAYAKSVKAMYATTDEFTSRVLVTDPSDDSQTITGGAGDDEYTFTFYSPLSVSYKDWNNYSPIMILEYRGFRYALSGDAEKENEAEFVKKVADAKTDGVTDKYDVFTDYYTVNAIKAGHHGSSTSTSRDYLDVITTPDGAKSAFYIISCGAGNSYGHPHAETIDRLSEMGVPDENVLRTDIAGSIALTVRADESGEYKMFYGGKAAAPVVTVYVYRELLGIKLKWAVVAWTCFAVVAVLLTVHAVVTVRKNSKRK